MPMDDSQTSPSGPLRVVATGIDAALEKLLAAAALRASVACEPAVAEAVARRQLESQAAHLAVVGDAPSGSAVEAIALAERLSQGAAVPILLISHSPIAAADGLRIAARGIDVLDASALDADALARRFVLHADACKRDERGRRAHALLRTQEALIAGLVHDLRTPLMAINLSAEVASVRSAEEVVQQAMRRIRSSTQRMARALDHLSNVARRDLQTPRDPGEAADLGHLARAALDAVGREQPGLGLGLHAIEAVVLAHGGSMVGRSKAPDGTVFELLLPRDVDG